ncbi:MAG: LAGLIDADG family homing endonuclease [Nanoarchaeota archaeon]
MNEKLAELLGLMAGDGCLSKTGRARYIYISGHKINDLEYHTLVTKKLFKELFDKEVKIEFRKDENTLFIRFSDKALFEELSEYLPIGNKYGHLKIPSPILQNKECFFAFVRGLADTDGCIIFSKQHRNQRYYPRIEITSKSKTFLIEILSQLKTHGFYGSVSHKGKENYRLEIPGNKNLHTWLLLIGFNNPTKMDKIRKYKSAPDQI